MPAARTSRPGRLPAAERAARRIEILETALRVLAEEGYPATTMTRVAQAAGASKETLYAWFGDKHGLIAAVVEHAESETVAELEDALPRDAEPRQVLIGFADGLLDLLLGPAAISIGRAAISEATTAPELGQLVLVHGRYRTGAIVEGYLAGLHERGVIHALDPAAAFALLFGLVVEDRQLRVLLGEKPPPPAVLRSHAQTSVDRFLALVQPA